MDDDILVVGGYGTIGRTVSRELAEGTSRRVVAAGRTAESAERFAASVDGVDPGVVDVDDPSTFDAALDGVGTAVVCLDLDDPAFAGACLDRGIDYVDVSPTDALLRRIEGFDDRARDAGATGVLSVGLSPGMTNLFVADALDDLDRVERVEISLLLGLGEAFGPDTVEWTIEEAMGEFSVREGGRQVEVRSFTDPCTVDLPGWGRRRLYRMNLADQHVLARTTEIPTIATRVCYDSRLVTAYLVALTRLGIADSLASLVGPRRLATILDRLPVGAEESVVQTRMTGVNDGQRTTITRWVRGPDQARATALVAATAVERIAAVDPPAGVHHLHELFGSDSFVETLRAAGYEVGRRTSREDAETG